MNDPISPPIPLEKRRTTVLLIDDQPIVGEAVRRMLQQEVDVDFHFCTDPNQALAQAQAVSPTVILQDLLMPGVDGLDLVKWFRQETATCNTPLIVLSSEENAKVKAQAFANGANDYLIKLPAKEELIARIRYHSRGYIHMLERNDAFETIVKTQKKLEAELAEAADYVQSMLPEPTEWSYQHRLEIHPFNLFGRRRLRIPLAGPGSLCHLSARRSRTRRRGRVAFGIGAGRVALSEHSQY